MSLRVLVTSDTHLELGARLPDELVQLASEADHVLHAGDLVAVDVLRTFEALAPVTAVHGNVCDGATRAVLPERNEIELAGVRVGIVHDAGPAAGRHARLRSWFPSCEVVVYGHSHQPELERTEDGAVLVINPGSPTQRRRAPSHTACWLELSDGAVLRADLVELP